MSTRAKGADAEIVKRITVGLTASEAETLEAKARAADLSLSRYLVESGLTATLRVWVSVDHRPLQSDHGTSYVADVILGAVRGRSVGDQKYQRASDRDYPRVSKSDGTGRYNCGRRLPLGLVVVWRCKDGWFRIATVGPRGLGEGRWFSTVADADAEVERLLTERGR